MSDVAVTEARLQALQKDEQLDDEWRDDVDDLLKYGRRNWVGRRELVRQLANSVDDVIGRQRRETPQDNFSGQPR